MKQNLHPEWFAEAQITCSTCGTVWTTGATIPELRVEICSNCHPFYTGEQRIVDTEGRVDKFYNRLKRRDQMRADEESRKAALTPPDLPLAELGLTKRYVTILEDNGIKVVEDVLQKLAEGEETLLEFPGIGRKVLADMKKMLRNRGYQLPEASAEAEAEPEAE